jgi:hypothetical protein
MYYLQKYFPGLANKVIESQIKDEVDKKVLRMNQNSLYIKSVKEYIYKFVIMDNSVFNFQKIVDVAKT